MNNILELIGRKTELLSNDILNHESRLQSIIQESRFLVIGGAGSIGQAVTKEIFKRNPKKLHVVDINENNLVELVRDLRSSIGYSEGEFKTLSIDVGSPEYDAFIKSDGMYDYVLNLSALKHVRSEKDQFTLMRMVDVNIINTEKTLKQSIANGVKKYFCVSTDKAANPVNLMGASKKIMEMFIMRRSEQIEISTARFANVAFSDGSLLHGFNQRFEKMQPIVAPTDIKRYFITPEESGQICLISCIFGNNRDNFFPKLNTDLHMNTFSDIAEKYLRGKGFEPVLCNSENEARLLATILPKQKKWPCFFSKSDTTGEKPFEEFYTKNERLDLDSYVSLGVVKNNAVFDHELLEYFLNTIKQLKDNQAWTKQQIVDLFFEMIPGFNYMDIGKNLDDKM